MCSHCDTTRAPELPGMPAKPLIQTQHPLDGLYFASRAEQSAAVDELEQLVPRLPDEKHDFAYSMIRQYRTKRSLSERQWPWVGKFIAWGRKGDTVAETVAIGSDDGMKKVFDLFQIAKGKLKYPAIVLAHGAHEIRLNIAGPQSKFPGTVQVVLINPRTADREWMGRIHETGVFEKSRRVDEMPADLLALLGRFAADPAKEAAEYGRVTGKCCFCHTALDDATSREAGFGPTCAKNYGLTGEYKAAKIRVKAGADRLAIAAATA